MDTNRRFVDIQRETPQLRTPLDRIKDYALGELPFSAEKTRAQAKRCMECGVPFCTSACPLENMIPDFNALVACGLWEEALEILTYKNSFPEFTGMVCPGLCESSCCLGLIKPPTSIKTIESAIINKAFEMGYISPVIPSYRSGKKVAIIGSGPSGLAAATKLNQAGHYVTIFESSNKAGGLLTYGIPAYKLPKNLVSRRVNLLKKEGIQFELNCSIPDKISFYDLQKNYDAVLVCIGSERPRDLPIPGRKSNNIYFAMDLLANKNKRFIFDRNLRPTKDIAVKDKRVIVIGGGDTGSDCIGVCLREGAKSVINLELSEKPPTQRTLNNPWPQYAKIYRKSSSMEENEAVGGKTIYNTLTTEFLEDDDNNLKAIRIKKVNWEQNGGHPPRMIHVPNSESSLECDIVFLALGYVSPITGKLREQLAIELDQNGTIVVNEKTKMTNIEGVFACGDCVKGQSLVAHAIRQGEDAAYEIDIFLQDCKQ